MPSVASGESKGFYHKICPNPVKTLSTLPSSPSRLSDKMVLARVSRVTVEERNLLWLTSLPMPRTKLKLQLRSKLVYWITVEERNLLSVAYKNVIGGRRPL
jgi:hypothetical protein